jgi:hypothetical protein
MNKELNEHEIDILDLLIKTQNIVKKNKFLLLKIFIAPVIISFAIFCLKPKIYQSHFVLSSSQISSDRIAIILYQLTELAEEGNYKELSKDCKLSTAATKEIKKINATVLDIAEGGAKDFQNHNVEVVFSVKNEVELLDSVQKGIIYFIKNNPYVINNNNTEIHNLEQSKINIEKEIKDLENLRIQTLANKSFGDNPSDINLALINLKQQLLVINSKLSSQDNTINMVTSITKTKSPLSPILYFYILIGVLAGLFLVFLSVSVIYIKNKYTNSIIE